MTCQTNTYCRCKRHEASFFIQKDCSSRFSLAMTLVFFFGFYSVFAQDIHFSQFNFSPLNLNPANAALFDGNARFTANYRNQWFNVPVNFNTISTSADMPVYTLKNRNKIGAGVVFYYDRVGDSRFTSLQAMLSVSYILNLGKNDKHSISAGFNVGVGNRSFQYHYLYFDNQYNGDRYVPDLESGESFPNTKLTYPEVGAGVAYQFRLSERKVVTVGFSMNHLNQPKQSFFLDNNVKLNIRYTANARARWKVHPKLDVVPEVLFQQQDTKYEAAFGMHTKAFVFKQKNAQICLNTGVYYRNNDAVYALLGMDYNAWQVNLSYDVNISRFQPASSTYGALEISVIYIMAWVKNVNSKGSDCSVL